MGFAPMAVMIRTQRLILSPWEDGDVESYRALIAERGDGVPAAETVREKMAAQDAQMAKAGIRLLAMRRRSDDGFVGYCGLTIGRASVEEPEIAYELLRREWGQGLATEAGRAIVEAARRTGRRRLWATIGDWNGRSLRVAGKLGFHRDHSSRGDRGEVIWMTRALAPHIPNLHPAPAEG
jgi:RimJ/RimL family protein N-acetyltransferase